MKYMLVVVLLLGPSAFAVPNVTVKDLKKLIVPEEGEEATIELVKGGKSTRSTGSSGTHGAPVWGPFVKRLENCAPGCSPVNYHAWRNTGGGSCHDVGRALDVFGFNCGGKVYWAPTQKFAQIVACFRKSGFKVIHNSANHYDHGHFSITCRGGSYW